jgi:hypothetical protein
VQDWSARGRRGGYAVPGAGAEGALGDASDRRRSSWPAPGCVLIGYVTVAPWTGDRLPLLKRGVA